MSIRLCIGRADDCGGANIGAVELVRSRKKAENTVEAETLQWFYLAIRPFLLSRPANLAINPAFFRSFDVPRPQVSSLPILDVSRMLSLRFVLIDLNDYAN